MKIPTPLYQDPFKWFDDWFTEVTSTEMEDPNAMCLSTVDEAGFPSSRTVLLKAYDREGFVFYTNLESQKGREVLATEVAALCFFWRGLNRQIRISGRTEQVSDAIADAYFASRPRGSQIGAWASDQSRPLRSREALMERQAELEQKYKGREVPRPPHWSGVRVRPIRIEFWQAGEYRLHDRFVFERSSADEEWEIVRLNP